ncbi:hypothetical protein CYY_004966 [Polysphondylium violaceum]|uniref:Armadillo-like helical domain-containing protein n=1 Tax=Polysphondylium violaceum TaxID=133409 RepID=A0A8J4PTS7_9MYCE|nr:hypothetical protein CYY_004966 [Polysphondylium violaceum]
MSTDSPTSPSSSSIMNRRGTFSKAKSFRRAGLNLEVNASSSGQPHVFRFLNGEEYSGPDICHSPPITPRIVPSSVNLESEEYKQVVYLGANGTLYNKYYIAIKYIGIDDSSPAPSPSSSSSSSNSSPSTSSPSTNNKASAASTKGNANNATTPAPKDIKQFLQFNSNDPIYQKFPEHLDYDNYFDYEQSLIEWKQQVQKNLGVLQLPHAMGRTYSRPKVFYDRFLRKNSEASNDDSLSFESERKLTDSDIKESNDDDNTIYSNSPSDPHNRLKEEDAKTIDGRDRSGSDTSTGSFDGSAPLDSSPIDGSPSTGSLAGFIANGTRSRSNSSTYFDHRINRSNSLSPKQTLQRLTDSGDTHYNKMMRGGSLLNMDEDRWFLSKDPWNDQLILQEPIPEIYDNFEEYEFAMRNWSTELATKTSILPPHSTQFIQLPNKDKNSGAGENGLAHSSEDNKLKGRMGKDYSALEAELSRLQFVDLHIQSPSMKRIVLDDSTIFDAIHKSSKLSINRFTHLFDDIPLVLGKEWSMLPNNLKIDISDTFDKWYRKKLISHRQTSGSYAGGVWATHLLMPNIKSGWKDSITKKQSILPPLNIKAARRLDINSEADGKRVEFNCPIPEIPINFNKLIQPNMNIQYLLGMFDASSTGPATTINLNSSLTNIGTSGSSTIGSGIGSNSNSSNLIASLGASHNGNTVFGGFEDQRNYIKTLQAYDRRLIHSFRLDHLYSWNDAKYTPVELQGQIQELESVVTQPNFDLNILWDLICNPSIYLDKFQECFDFPDHKLYAVTLPMIPAIVPLIGFSSSSTGSPTNTTGNRTPNTPNVLHLGSPPNRSGSTGSFSLGSPASSKLPLSPSHNNSLLSSGLESPRATSQNGSSVIGNLASSANGSSPRSQVLANGSTPSACSNQFLGLITSESFVNLLKFLDRSQDPLVLSKVATLVTLSLSSELKGTMIIESIIFFKDINSLYRIAKAISFFDAVPLDIFPCPSHINEILTPVIAKGSTLEVVRLVFMYYYLGIIQERLPFYSNNVGVLGFINSSKKDTAERIGININTDKDFLSRIFRALGRKSFTVSNAFLFILIQLMKMTESPSVQAFLKIKDGLITHLRDLCESKFNHSQFAAQRIFTILQEEQVWREFLFAEYSENTKKMESQLLTDLTNCDEKGKTTLLSRLVFNLCMNTLENISTPVSKHVYKFLLNEFIFYQLFNSIIKSKKINHNTENLSKLFAVLCKTLVKLSMLKNNENIKSKRNQNDSNTEQIQITPNNLFEILTFLQQHHQLSDKYANNIRTNVLVALRHLLKPADIFEILKKEANLYNKLLIPSCRDAKNPEFNRNSWRLFFQIIRYHPNHLEYLEKNKFLNQFMDIISLNAGNIVLTNALYYLTKLFALVTYETKKNQLKQQLGSSALGLGGVNIDVKYTEKDVKNLLSFFVERHLFIKIHMIYKRFSESKTYPGFVQLANLYQTISTLPICQKLLKDTIKNAEYKEGIVKVSKWFKLDENTK